MFNDNKDMTYREMFGIDEQTDDELVSKILSYIFKTELIYTVSIEQLLKIYNTKEAYEQFLGLVSILLKEEPEFLVFLNDALDDISSVINCSRYKYSLDSGFNSLENEIILNLNRLKNYVTDEFIDEFSDVQKNIRGCDFKNNEELLLSIAYDSQLIAILNTNNMENVDNKLFIASTLYLLEDFSKIYISKSDYIDKTIEQIDKIKKESSIKEKRKIRFIKKELHKLN